MAIEPYYNEKMFLIFPTSQINSVDFNGVLESSQNTLRLSIDQTKTFVKWIGATPSCLYDLTNTEGPYNHSEMLVKLSTPEWKTIV